MSEPKAAMKHETHRDWCHVCGTRSYQTVSVWFPGNAEHDPPAVPGPPHAGRKYLRICSDCGLRVARVAAQPCRDEAPPRPRAAGGYGLTLWEVRGEAASDGGGGDEVIVVLAPNHRTLSVLPYHPVPPDVCEAIRNATAGRYEWYDIRSVRALGPVSAAYRVDHPLHDRGEPAVLALAGVVTEAVARAVGAVGHTPAPFVGPHG